jgi:putative holliday junction resolvase
MARLMAIDYGQKRIGIAVTDPLQIIPNALETVPTEKIFDFLKKYCSEEEVERFIVGEPFHADGNPTYLTPLVHVFIKKLNEIFPNIPVSTWDESFSSVKARQAIMASGAKKKTRQDKALVDRVSASIILGEYMDSI